MEWMFMPLRRFADFQGRSRRKEYWMFALLMVLVNAAIMLMFSIIGTSPDGSGLAAFVILMLVLAAAFFVPSLAVTVRRLHDQNKSGWFALLILIPYVGGLILLVLMCLDGTPGGNRFGADPKAQSV